MIIRTIRTIIKEILIANNNLIHNLKFKLMEMNNKNINHIMSRKNINKLINKNIKQLHSNNKLINNNLNNTINIKQDHLICINLKVIVIIKILIIMGN